jgi:hypothetical protein
MNQYLGRTQTTWEGIRLEDPDVAMTVVYLQAVIRKLVANQYRHYMGQPVDWVDAVSAQAGSECHMPPAFFRGDSSGDLSAVLRKVSLRIIDCDFSNTFEVEGQHVHSTAGDAKSSSGDDDDSAVASRTMDAPDPDDITETVYEGEDEPDAGIEPDRDQNEPDGDSVVTQADSKISQSEAEPQSMPEGKSIGDIPTMELDSKKRLSRLSAPVPISEVASLVESLTQSQPLPSVAARGRPKRLAAPVVGQFQAIAQEIQIVDRGHVVPISPNVKRRRRQFSKR